MIAHAQIDRLCINTIRTLSMEAVQQANSAPPLSLGAPLQSGISRKILFVGLGQRCTSEREERGTYVWA
jgi:transketolase